MSLGEMRQSGCLDSLSLDSLSTMDSLDMFLDDPLMLTASDVLEDIQDVDHGASLTLNDLFADTDDIAAFTKASLGSKGDGAEALFHIQSIESATTTAFPAASGLIESRLTKFELTCSTHSSASEPSKFNTGLLTPLHSSLSFFDDPDETDGDTPTANAVNPAVLKKKTKRPKSGYGKIQKPKKSKQPKSPRQPKPPKPGSWNVQLEVHMSHCQSGRLVVSNPEKLAINEDKVGGIYPLTPKTTSLDAQSISTASIIADSYEFMDF